MLCPSVGGIIGGIDKTRRFRKLNGDNRLHALFESDSRTKKNCCLLVAVLTFSPT